MTIVVAAKRGDDIWMAGDRQISWGDHIRTDQSDFSKLVPFKNAVIGHVGMILYGTALRYWAARNPEMFNAPFANRNDVLDFFFEFYNFLAKDFQLGKASSNEVARIKDSGFLVVTREAMYQITDNRDVTEFQNYVSIGSGSKYGYGVLYALYNSRKALPVILKTACEAASEYNKGCSGQPDIIDVTAALSHPVEQTPRLIEPVTRPAPVQAAPEPVLN